MRRQLACVLVPKHRQHFRIAERVPPAADDRKLLRAAMDPSHISGRNVREFLFRASPEQQEKSLQRAALKVRCLSRRLR
jgi:hypothetical protein